MQSSIESTYNRKVFLHPRPGLGIPRHDLMYNASVSNWVVRDVQLCVIYLLYRKALVIVRRHEKLGQATLSAIEYHSQSKSLASISWITRLLYVVNFISMGIYLSIKLISLSCHFMGNVCGKGDCLYKTGGCICIVKDSIDCHVQFIS